jgi:hypothetical protein
MKDTACRPTHSKEDNSEINLTEVGGHGLESPASG